MLNKSPCQNFACTPKRTHSRACRTPPPLTPCSHEFGLEVMPLLVQFKAATLIMTLKEDIKRIMVETLMLQVTADEITDDLALFGPGSLGLDSVDALQLVVALDKNYGLKIPDPEAARVVFQNVSSIVEAVARHQSASLVTPAN